MTEAQNEETKKTEGCGCGAEEPCCCQEKCACGEKAADAAEAAPEAPAEDTRTPQELRAALKASEQKVLEHYDLYVRAMAELENTRRRSSEELLKTRKFAIEKFAENLLPVVDSLEKALETTAAEKDNPVREGMEATYRQLVHALDVSDMKPIDPKGQPFDPNLHMAITMVPAPEGVKAGSVVQVFQRGWSIAGRVLRPAMVSVAQG